jgi:GntR family transcriptional regulator
MLGDLAIGSKLPSMRELEAQFATTSRTVQDALHMLREEGFIVGQRGQGVYVLTRQPHVVDVSAYVVPTPTGFKYDIVDVREVVPPADVAAVLGLPPEGKAVLRHRMTTLGGEPLEVDKSYYPTDVAHGTDLMSQKRIRGGAPRVLAEAGFPQREFTDRVSVRQPTTEEVEALGLPDAVPVIQQFRIIYSDDKRPVEVSVLAKPGHLYELRYRQTI